MYHYTLLPLPAKSDELHSLNSRILHVIVYHLTQIICYSGESNFAQMELDEMNLFLTDEAITTLQDGDSSAKVLIACERYFHLYFRRNLPTRGERLHVLIDDESGDLVTKVEPHFGKEFYLSLLLATASPQNNSSKRPTYKQWEFKARVINKERGQFLSLHHYPVLQQRNSFSIYMLRKRKSTILNPTIVLIKEIKKFQDLQLCTIAALALIWLKSIVHKFITPSQTETDCLNYLIKDIIYSQKNSNPTMNGLKPISQISPLIAISLEMYPSWKQTIDKLILKFTEQMQGDELKFAINEQLNTTAANLFDQFMTELNPYYEMYNNRQSIINKISKSDFALEWLSVSHAPASIMNLCLLVNEISITP